MTSRPTPDEEPQDKAALRLNQFEEARRDQDSDDEESQDDERSDKDDKDG